MLRRRSSQLVSGLVLTLAAAGCGSSPATPPVRTSASTQASNAALESPASTPTPTAPPTPAPLAAPLMIQVENLYQARPQSGLSTADIVYEYDTEGQISRFTGLWFAPPPASYYVGPVRSARLVDLRLLRIYGGVLLYSGASNYTQAHLNSSGLRWRDPDNSGSTLYRLFSRSAPPSLLGAPHNLYTDGARLATLERQTGMGQVGYQLWARTPVASLPAGGSPVSSFQVPVTQSERPIFTYVPGQGAYSRDEPGGGYYPGTGVLDDADTGQPWMVPNVVVLQVPVITVPQDNEDSANVPWVDGLDFAISGSGAGQVAVGGQLYAVTWTQGASGPPQLTLADGQPAPLAPGQVVIELVSPGSTVAVRS
jgi:hypothetical protein